MSHTLGNDSFDVFGQLYSSVVEALEKTLEEVRRNVDSTHLVWHKETVPLGSSIGVTPSVLRQCGRQANRDNTPTEDCVSYYQLTLTTL